MVTVTRTTVRDQQLSGMKSQRLLVERSQEKKLPLERSEPSLVLMRGVDLIDELLRVSLARLDY